MLGARFRPVTGFSDHFDFASPPPALQNARADVTWLAFAHATSGTAEALIVNTRNRISPVRAALTGALLADLRRDAADSLLAARCRLVDI